MCTAKQGTQIKVSSNDETRVCEAELGGVKMKGLVATENKRPDIKRSHDGMSRKAIEHTLDVKADA